MSLLKTKLKTKTSHKSKLNSNQVVSTYSTAVNIKAKNMVGFENSFEIYKFAHNCMQENRYEHLLENSYDWFNFQFPRKDTINANNFIYDGIQFKIKFGQDLEDSEIHMQNFIIFATGISALQVFVRSNLFDCSGNETTESKWDEFFRDLSPSKVRCLLGGDMDMLSPNVQKENLLLLSRLCLSLPLSTCTTLHWWNIRSLMTHQRVLTDKISSIHDKILAEYEMLIKQPWMNNDSAITHTAKILICIEMSQMHIYYHEHKKASELFELACSFLGLTIKLHGALGKRTQYQLKEVPQLMVKIERSHELDLWSDLVENEGLPKGLSLQDDTLLNNVKFQGTDDNEVQDLDPLEQLVLFALCSLEKNIKTDKLSEEQVLTYLNYLIEQPKVWSVHLMSLVLRSRYEKTHSRRNDRAIRQMEAVIYHLKQHRTHLHMIYATGFPMFWQLEKELADVLASVGAVRSALDIYKRYNLWHELVACYMELGQMVDAKEVVEKQLAVKKTPLLLCLLGDIEKNPDHYQSAFELSKQTCYRSQRSLGFWYYKQHNFEKCIGYFIKSVELNHLQSDVWFALGFTAGQVGDLTLAAKAYRHLLHLDGDNFEAWNNLSAAYIGSGQKERAWRTLQEALRCNYDEHRVWENFLCVCVDVGAFEDAIRAYHRLLDLRGSLLDVSVLKILIKAVVNNLRDRKGKPASHLKKNLLELFGRLTSTTVARNHQLWELYSCLKHPSTEVVEDFNDLESAHEYQQKAVSYHPIFKSPSLDISPPHDSWLSLIELGNRYSKLTDLYLKNLQDGRNYGAKKCIANFTLKKVLNLSKNLSGILIDSKASEMVLEMKRVLTVINEL